MAKPRVFISSTYYDLKQTREDIAIFLSSMGYEPVRNEEGNIPYGQGKNLEAYCYREIENVDILVSIIGGRYGSESSDGSKWSISNNELKTALSSGKQVYIFIDKSVNFEYETYLCNKGNEKIKYRFVDNKKIFEFIEEIKQLTTNNNIKAFDTSADIISYLKEQLAGLFQSYLSQQRNETDLNLSMRLENTAKTLENLVTLFQEKDRGQEDRVNKLLKMNNQFTAQLISKLGIKFNIWIDGLKDLNELLSFLGWKYREQSSSEDKYHEWSMQTQDGSQIHYLRIMKSIFEEDDELRYIKAQDWQNSYITIVKEDLPQSTPFDSIDNLPF